MKRETASRMWFGWAVAGCVLEAVTCAQKGEGLTLSSNVMDLCRIHRRQPFNEKLRRAITIGFITWLPIHWASGGKI